MGVTESKENKSRYLATINVSTNHFSVFNPNRQDYLIFSEETNGLKISEDVVVERIDFYLFSTYSVQALHYEHGTVHLGFKGRYFQSSKGQYDYPSWLEFFN